MTIYGQLGVMCHSEDGAVVQCHFCGRAFAHLGNHVKRTHHMTADQYRLEVGLNATTGLISRALTEKRAATLRTIPEMNDRERGRMMLSSIPTEVRSAQARHPRSLEERLAMRERGGPLEKMMAARNRNTHYRRSTKPPLICAQCKGFYLAHTMKGHKKYCSMSCYGLSMKGHDRDSARKGRLTRQVNAKKRLDELCRGCHCPIGARLTAVAPTKYLYLNRGICSAECQAKVYPVRHIRASNGQYLGRERVGA